MKHHRFEAIVSGIIVLIVQLGSHKNYDFSNADIVTAYIFSLICVFVIFYLVFVVGLKVLKTIYYDVTGLRESAEEKIDNGMPEQDSKGREITAKDNKSKIDEKSFEIHQNFKMHCKLFYEKVEELHSVDRIEEFFNCYDLATHYRDCLLEDKRAYKKIKSDDVFVDGTCKASVIIEEKFTLISELNDFIDRSVKIVVEQNESASKSKRREAIKKWHSSFDDYLDRMPEATVMHLHEKYGSLLSDLDGKQSYLS